VSDTAAATPPRPPWPGRHVTLSTGRLHVREAPGEPTADGTAVLVHGLGGSSTNWTDLMALVRSRVSGVAADLPGFGWSDPPAHGDYSLRAHVSAVTALIEEQVGEPVHLVGNSLGGTVVTVVAATRPDLVRTLTLVSPALPVLRPRRSNVHLPALAVPFAGQRLARRLGRFPVEARVRATLALCFADPSRVPPQRVADAIAEASRRARLAHDQEALLASLRSLIGAYLAPRRWPLWRLAERVTAPTLLVYGLADRLVDPRTASRAVRAFPYARLVTIPDSGHMSQVEHPELVAAELLRFLAGSHDRARPAPVR